MVFEHLDHRPLAEDQMSSLSLIFALLNFLKPKRKSEAISMII